MVFATSKTSRDRAAARGNRCACHLGISGTILDHNNSPLPGGGVVFNSRGGLFGKTTTNENGRYSQDGFSSGTYTLTASSPGFAARTQTVVVAGADTAADFQLKALAYSISGTVTTPDGSVIPEAMVTLDDPAGSSTATDGEGRYYFADLAPKAYVLTVSNLGYVTEAKTMDIVDPDTAVDLALAVPTRTMRGVVTASDGTALAGAALENNGPAWNQTTTRNTGDY